MRFLVVLVATAAAALVLVVNIILLDHATRAHDPVGRLTPSSVIVRPLPSRAPRPSPRQGELPDD